MKEHHIMKTYKRTQRTLNYIQDIYGEFSGSIKDLSFEKLLREELKNNDVSLKHVTFKDAVFG